MLENLYNMINKNNAINNGCVKMKAKKFGKIAIVFVTLLFLTSTFVSGYELKNDRVLISTNHGGQHEIPYNYNDWSEHNSWEKHYTDGDQGDAETDKNGGYCSVSCSVTYTGELWEKAGFEGKTYFSAPINVNDAKLLCKYPIKYNYRYYSDFGNQGDWAKGHIRCNVSLYKDGTLIEKHIYDSIMGHGKWDVDGAFEFGDSSERYELSDYFTVDFNKNSEYYFLFEADVFSAVGLFAGPGEVKSRAKIEVDLSQMDIYAMFIWENRPPSVPDTPSGPMNINLGSDPSKTCTYTTSADDPDGEFDSLTYDWCFPSAQLFSYGAPGETTEKDFTWDVQDARSEGLFVKVRVYDKFSSLTGYSDELSIQVNPKIHPKIYDFLANRFTSFPVFSEILKNILF